MKKFVMMAVAALAMTAFSSSDATAQDLAGGYQFGVGLNYSNGFNGAYNNHFRGGRLLGRIGGVHRAAAPPYFAQFPPVYYNGIVSRPYGISPYAAPPGVRPVEMNVPQVQPLSIKNPYFDGKPLPASKEVTPAKASNDQSTMIGNPYTGAYSKK